MILAIVPAAGKSERMGRPKLLLPLGSRRVIEHVLAALADSQVDRTVVVLPPGDAELLSVVRAQSVEAVVLTELTPDMRASILAGLDHAEKTWPDDELEAFLVALADQPTISPRTVDHLIARFRSSTRSIFIPNHAGRRGHPVLFAWRHAAHVRAIPPGHGLNHLVAALAAEVEEWTTEEAGSIEDLDTPQDYERLRGREWPDDGDDDERHRPGSPDVKF